MVDYSKWDKIDYEEESQQATPSISIADIGNTEVSEGDKSLNELMQHVQSMDCNEAYKQLCLAQDEIKRLQQLELEEGTDITLSTTQQLSLSSKDIIQSETSDTVPQINKLPQAAQMKSTSNNTRNNEHIKPRLAISGSWLDCQDDSKKLCSIEYLPNVKCYQITLLSNNTEDIPQFKEELQFDIVSIAIDNDNDKSIPHLISYYEAKLYRLKFDEHQERQLLLSVTLPISSTSNESPPTARISLDTNSISIRIQHNLLSMVEMDDSFGIVDNLLGIELSSFASVTTDPNDLNYLHCRACQNPIVEPPSSQSASNDNTIQSVLPLPTGYWDDISDYLICYDGQAIVDFTSSTTTAIKQSVLEDDAVLVLHQDDLIQNQQRKGIRIGRVKGYGEHSSGNEDASSSEAWKDKAAIKGAKSKTITCAKCCFTLGFVSNNDNDSSTYRLYKHLLDCGKPPNTSIFSKYTCGSFLAREMVRYAENDAIYTFIVGISDEMDWTRAHNPGPCILIRMLSWDTPMAIVDKNSTTDESNTLQFHKVVKVIFEEVSDKVIDTTNSNDSTEWTWRGVDFCCPPNGTSGDETTSSEMQTKASSIRIFFSQHEWAELKDTLIDRSMYFSEAIKEAVVMTKLGLPTSDEEEQEAAFSFLSLVS